MELASVRAPVGESHGTRARGYRTLTAPPGTKPPTSRGRNEGIVAWHSRRRLIESLSIPGQPNAPASTADAIPPSRQDDVPHQERRYTMGDKGGKKEKNKSQKQMAGKRTQKTKEKRDKQQPSTS